MPDYKSIGRILSKAMLPCYFDDPVPLYDSESDDAFLVETDSFKISLPVLGAYAFSLPLANTHAIFFFEKNLYIHMSYNITQMI